MKVLEVENLIRNYRRSSLKKSEEDVKVLKGLNFAVEEGEFVGIMGKSGCGKTTLLKVLGMIDKQTGGTVRFMEEDVSEIYGDRLADVRRKQIGFIFQDFYLMDSLSVEENITLMDLSVMDNAMARMMLETINNMMLELYASMAQAELEKKEKRQREGIEAKKLRGEWDDYGRPSVMKQETFDENFQSVVSGETTPTQLRKNLGMTHSTFYRYRKTFYEKYPELSNSAN